MKRFAPTLLGFVALAFVCLPSLARAAAGDRGDGPWPVAVKDFAAPKPGEHPRLFFRAADVPELRKRAQTPEGKAIVERCKFLLGIEGNPPQEYTLWHGAAAGFLYQATGDKKYADL